MAAIVRPALELANVLQAQAYDVETFVRGPCSIACGAFMAAWSALRPIASPALATECAELERQIRGFAAIVSQLQDGRYQLCAWQAAPGDYRIGIVKRGSVPDVELGWLPLVPVLVIGAAAVGVWVLLDLYLSARELEAKAAVKRAELQSQATAAISAAPPDQRAQLAAAIAKANASVAPDWLTRLGAAITDTAASIGEKFGMLPWLALIAVLALSGRRRW